MRAMTRFSENEKRIPNAITKIGNSKKSVRSLFISLLIEKCLFANDVGYILDICYIVIHFSYHVRNASNYCNPLHSI